MSAPERKDTSRLRYREDFAEQLDFLGPTGAPAAPPITSYQQQLNFPTTEQGPETQSRTPALVNNGSITPQDDAIARRNAAARAKRAGVREVYRELRGLVPGCNWRSTERSILVKTVEHINAQKQGLDTMKRRLKELGIDVNDKGNLRK